MHADTGGVGRFEQLPKWLNLVPMVLQWIWLGLRHGSFTLPSAANPGITSGGLVGEGKMEYFDAMGETGRAATARHVVIIAAAQRGLRDLLLRMQDAGLDFPVVAKPDIGWCGYGVRLLHQAEDLADYARRFPAGADFVLQRYLPDPGEAGLFYMRHPGEASGRLIGILLRDYPVVLGNGHDCIATLVAKDARIQRGSADPMHEISYDATRIPLPGEQVRLSTVASTRVGGRYRDGSTLATPALVAAVDAIAKDMGDPATRPFLVGRYDVRYRDEESLQRGDFTIMEVNGAGSEAVHAWDPKYRIRDVYRIVYAKQRRLFAIGAEQRRRGHRPISLAALARLYWRQQRLIARYPASN
ncbi:hypothetical protein [Thermomonas sp.]|uniref:hypothetical protein n=1 Tax=Thermomonas sp. TaxID=1971895 RepID=UPI0024874F77|nr:hypothetical protein [Thermomonas sp.]MDI1253632.1 hypothetical protein [Thermomonas sp.]